MLTQIETLKLALTNRLEDVSMNRYLKVRNLQLRLQMNLRLP